MYILEVLPTDGKIERLKNDKVYELNDMLSKLPNFVHLNGLDKNGLLIHTYDGLHLDDYGNKIFLSELSDLLVVN